MGKVSSLDSFTVLYRPDVLVVELALVGGGAHEFIWLILPSSGSAGSLAAVLIFVSCPSSLWYQYCKSRFYLSK